MNVPVGELGTVVYMCVCVYLMISMKVDEKCLRLV